MQSSWKGPKDSPILGSKISFNFRYHSEVNEKLDISFQGVMVVSIGCSNLQQMPQVVSQQPGKARHPVKL